MCAGWVPAVIVASVLGGCGRVGFDAGRTTDASGITDAEPSADAEPCADYSTWAQLPGRYRVGPQVLSWSIAEADCESDGGHLIVIDDAIENLEARTQATGEFWIGMTDRITEATYLTVLGTPPGFEGWPGATPTNTGEDCVSVLINSDWEDRNCTGSIIDMKAYVCECDGLPVDPTSF